MPNNRSDGIEIYNGTGTSYSDTGLNAFTTYYYRAWSITDTPDRQFSDPPDATASATTWSPKTILAKGDAYQLVINGTTLYGYINGVPLVSTTIDTNWHHVAFTYDGSTAKLYLDGDLKDINTSYSQTIKTNDENLLIGKNFRGTLDEVRLWSRALTWEEINASYNAKAIGSYYHNFTDLTYGNYTYYAYAIDTAGNENTTETRYYNCTTGGNQPPQNGIPILNNFDDMDNAYAKKKWYNITVTYSDPNGYSDLKYMRMEFKQGTITRAVFNYTEATDTFTQEDGLNKFQLDTTGSIAIKSGNNITVHWHFKPLWGADEEADVDIQCYCVDNSGLSDSDIYNDQFDVVTNLLTATIECNDTNDPDRVSINENIRINFSIRYANDPGSNTPSTSYPPDDEFNSVSVINSSGIIMATDTTITNGNGSVTFNAPATVGSDNYTLYIDMADSDYNDGEETNLKEWIITDRVNITSITVTNYSYYDGSRYWDGNSPITITYTAILDYDGTSFDGEVNAGYFGNTTAWGSTTNLAVAPNDYSSGLIITRDGVTAGSVANGGTYGITAIIVSASKPDVGWDGICPTCSIEYNSSATYFKAGEKLRIYANFSTGGGTGINESTVKISITTQGDGDLAQTAMIKTDNTHWYYDWIIPSGSDEDGNFTVSITAKDNVSNPLNPDPTNDTSKYIDNSPPNTSVDAISPYRVTSKPKTITVTANDNLSGLYNVTLWYRFSNDNQSWGGWTINETKNSSPWQWSFDFPNGTGYYEFYSIGVDNVGNVESAPSTADAECYYNPNNPPIINSIDLRNDTGSKLDSDQMIDVNKEYYFLINVTDPDGWDDINYINITAWYDNGNESSYYNQTAGGNLNLFLQYKNTTGTAEYKLLWPDDEAELILTNCSETIINSTTREIKISFKPRSQFRYAPGDGVWDATQNVTDDLYSWNVNVTVEDNSSARSWMKGEFGVYRYVNIEVPSNWIGVEALPGSYDDSNVVTITFSSNYDYILSLWFSTELVNQSTGSVIPISGNVYALSDADPDDDITTDTTFSGTGESNAIEIINASGTFKPDGVSQSVNVQFRVYIPFGTLSGTYKANTRTKIEQKA